MNSEQRRVGGGERRVRIHIITSSFFAIGKATGAIVNGRVGKCPLLSLARKRPTLLHRR